MKWVLLVVLGRLSSGGEGLAAEQIFFESEGLCKTAAQAVLKRNQSPESAVALYDAFCLQVK